MSRPPCDRWRGGGLVAALSVAAAFAWGCGTSTMRGQAPLPHSRTMAAAAHAGDLMSQRDRDALARLSALRASEGRDGYRIGPDDLLEVRIPKLLTAQSETVRVASAAGGAAALPSVTAAPVFQQGVRVSAMGDVTLPLLGTVPAAGRTPAQLEGDIARRLVSAGILKNPQVSVQIAEHRSNVVGVVGSVERPGLYPLTKPGATIADFVWAAGGPTKDAGRSVTFTPIEGGTRGEPIVIDLDVLTKERAAGPNPVNPVAMAGDVLTIAPAGSVQVDGWVEKPGSYPVTRGLTLTGAVAAAGGHLFPADRKHVTVKRVTGGNEQKFITVDLEAVASGRTPDFPITDGDVVHLPVSTEKAVPWGAYQAVKEMIHVGASFPIF